MLVDPRLPGKPGLVRCWAWILLLGCAGSGDGELIIQLRTDFVPVEEFTEVRIEAERVGMPGLVERVPARQGNDYLEAVTVARLTMPEGPTEIRIELLTATGEMLTQRRALVRVKERTGVTIEMTRSCRDVTCSDPSRTCRGGRCESVECTPETPEQCEVTTCADVSCEPALAACSESFCRDGLCFQRPAVAACSTDEWCHAENGCLPRADEGMVLRDAGVDASSPSDASAPDGAGLDAGTDTGPVDSGQPQEDASNDAATDAAATAPLPRVIVDHAVVSTAAGWTPIPRSQMVIDGSSTPGHDWLLFASARMASDAVSISDSTVGASIRVMVDGVERATGSEQHSGAGALAPFSSMVVLETLVSTASVEVQVLAPMAGAVETRDLHLVAIPVPPQADLHVLQDEGPIPVTSSRSVLRTLEITPSSPGEYLVLYSIGISEAPTSNTVFARVMSPDGSTWPIVLDSQRPAVQTYTTALLHELDGSEVTFGVEAGSTRDEGTIRQLRVVLMRTDAFPAVFRNENTTMEDVSSTEPVELGSLTTGNPGQPRDYLIFQSVLLGGDCSMEGSERQVRLESPDSPVIFNHAVDGCAYRSTYARFDVLRTDTRLTLRNLVASPDGADLRAYESKLYALEL